MKLPERQEFVEYAEGGAGQNAEVQRQILNLLASSPVVREQLAELKRDLYHVAVQVPEYRPEAPFAAELAKLAQNWSQLSYRRRFSVQRFYRSREFFVLMVFVMAALSVLLLFLGVRLLA